ncbi:MAG: A24 family peptidase C-terminal domain-containing protein [Promethearchaeota archaeon]
MIGSELNIILLIFAFLFLSIGSWHDIKTREVADWIWLSMIVGGIVIHIFQLILLILAKETILEYFMIWVVNIGFSLGLALFLTFSGLGGEADRIAFIAIGFISPISPPLILFQDPVYEILISITPRILGTFFNAYFIALPIPFLIFGYNVVNQRLYPDLYIISNESMWKRFSIRFIGYPRLTQNLAKELEERPWHIDFLEEFKEEGGWSISFRTRLDTPEADLTRKQNLISLIQITEKRSIWVQPSLPFIFILMLGFFIDILFGNLVLLFMVILL